MTTILIAPILIVAAALFAAVLAGALLAPPRMVTCQLPFGRPRWR